MKRRKLLRLMCAACLLLCAGVFAYRAAASVRELAPHGSAAKDAREASRVILRGKRLVTVAGYELNASFSPGGDFFCFELRAIGEKHKA